MMCHVYSGTIAKAIYILMIRPPPATKGVETKSAAFHGSFSAVLHV